MRDLNLLTDKSLNVDQALGDGVDGEQETLKSYRSEQSRSRGSDKASRVDFVTVEGEPYFGQRPSFIPAARSLDRARSIGSKFKPICKALRDNDECRTAIYKKFYFFGPAGRPT